MFSIPHGYSTLSRSSNIFILLLSCILYISDIKIYFFIKVFLLVSHKFNYILLKILWLQDFPKLHHIYIDCNIYKENFSKI